MSDAREFDPLGRILRFAGRRAPVDEACAARVEKNVRQRWQQMVARRRAAERRRRYLLIAGGFAMAAGIAAAAVLLPRAIVEPPVVATVVQLAGAPAGGARGQAMLPLGDGQALRAGSMIETAAAEGAALELASGHSLRLNGATRIRLETDAVVLDEGAIYLDSRGDRRAAAIEVRSVVGTVREVGTQYMVVLDGDTLTISVREGAVHILQGANSEMARDGERVTLGAAGNMSRASVPSYGDYWAWVAELTVAMPLDGRTLAEFLHWLAREQGWQLDYASPTVARDATRVEVHGSIDGLSAEDALAVVMGSTGWEYRLADGTLYVGRR